MKRHILLALLRVLLAVGVVFALPFSHAQWAEPYPGDGQQGFGFIIIFMIVGLVAAALFVGLGSLGQFLLRKRPARVTVFTDLSLFLLFAGVLVYGGVTARYNDSPPGNTLQPTPGNATGLSMRARTFDVVGLAWLLLSLGVR